MSQDPGCKGPNEAEAVVVDGGNLANVFVYVKEGLGSRTFDVLTMLSCLIRAAASTILTSLGSWQVRPSRSRTTIPLPTTSIPPERQPRVE